MRILYIAFVYNELPYIKNTISYYKKQGLDVYIIDNYSNDGTYEWLIENKVKCNRFDTNESFDLTKLQEETHRVIMQEAPEWIVYGAADLYYIFDKSVEKTIQDAEKLGCNQISVPCYGALNTGEDFNTPLYKTYFHGMYYRDLQMISKFDKDLRMNGDNIVIPNINTYNAPGIMINYGACKPIEEQKIKLKRRQKAWDEGLSVRTGKHFKWGESNNWIWEKEDHLNFHRCKHSKYFKKLFHENTIEKSKEYYNSIYKNSEKYAQDYSDIIYLPIYIKVLKKLNRQDSILELGCGAGHFAHLLKDNDYHNYVGVDFSAQAITQARKRTDQLFIEQDLLSSNSHWANYDTVVSLEVFEHLDYKKLLSKIKKGTQIIFSVPNFIIDSHLYCWTDEQEIKHDFDKYINIASIEIALQIKDKKWFLINGFVK